MRRLKFQTIWARIESEPPHVGSYNFKTRSKNFGPLRVAPGASPGRDYAAHPVRSPSKLRLVKSHLGNLPMPKSDVCPDVQFCPLATYSAH